MTEERFIEIMNTEYERQEYDGYCKVIKGLKIITKYLPKAGIDSAEHDIIYSTSISELLEAGITEEDVVELRKLNWTIDEYGDALAHYV